VYPRVYPLAMGERGVQESSPGRREVARFGRLAPLDRIRAAAAEMERHRRGLAVLASIRADAVEELLARGATQADVARELGVTPGAVAKLRTRSSDRPEGMLTVAEAGRRLGIRTTDVLRLVDTGEFDAVTEGGRILVPVAAVTARGRGRSRASARPDAR
jgi:transposase-like protein